MAEDLPEAYLIHSDVLDTEVWLVHRRLARQEWPSDGVCYTGAECEILLKVGQEVLPAVQMVKEALGATVVNGRRGRSTASCPSSTPPGCATAPTTRRGKRLLLRYGRKPLTLKDFSISGPEGRKSLRAVFLGPKAAGTLRPGPGR